MQDTDILEGAFFLICIDTVATINCVSELVSLMQDFNAMKETGTQSIQTLLVSHLTLEAIGMREENRANG